MKRDRLFMSRKEGERRLSSIEDSMDTSYKDSKTTLKRARKDESH